MKHVEGRLNDLYAWHRLEANRARCRAADKRASRFTKDDAEKAQALHTQHADTLEHIIKHWRHHET